MAWKNRTEEELREYNRKWYAKNSKRIQKERKLRMDALRERFREFKRTLVCERCGFDDWRALQFHHHGDKSANVSDMLTRGVSWDTLSSEIEKCEVICANCHMIEHSNHER